MLQEPGRREKTQHRDAEPVEARRRSTLTYVLLLAAALCLACLVYMALSPPAGKTPDASPSKGPLPADAPADDTAGQPATPDSGETTAIPERPKTAKKLDFSKFKGRWQRADGDYVIEVRDLAADGKADVAYFNPKPIRVSQAAVQETQGVPGLFVELRDAGYPGCTYTLIHDAENDVLAGVYYQAAQQESYEVMFQRVK